MLNFTDSLKEQFPEVAVREYEPMSLHTAFKSGGNARYYAGVDTQEQLIKLVGFSREHSISVKILGSGTNALVPMGGFDGLIIKNNCRRFELQGMKGKFAKNKLELSQAFLFAEAGAITNQVVRFVVDEGFAGLEFALGLPGTIGGAVCLNANFPKENILIGESLYAAKLLTSSGEIIDVDKNYFHFGFDTSRLQREPSILLSVMFSLRPEDKKTLWEKAERAVTYRTGTMPKNIPTGMTFRNMKILRIYPNSSFSEDTPVSLLLEKAGLSGYKVGGAELWSDNPNYIINTGLGKDTDVIKLLSDAKEILFRKFGVQLEVNPHILE